MSTYTIAAVRKPYIKRKTSAPDAGYFITELANVERAVSPVTGFVSIALSSDEAITLSTTNVLTGETGYVQVVQDETGGWLPTWTNATGTDGAVPVPSLAANSATLYAALYIAPTWILTVHASNYGNSAIDTAVERAMARVDSAMLPLPRTLVLLAGYAVTFDE